ncbi:MAG: SGNH/GDSL hydrolase family protein [Actinomycetota bacterium]|nr:SGNH/GDSL hydrolase family protein [Actinomycetota bacterium]
MSVSRALPLQLAGLLTATTLSACQEDAPSAPRDDAILEYVALGDSYAAAPHLPADDLSAPCLRSETNYPSLVADRLTPIHLTDVSCVGAMSAHLTTPQESGDTLVRPQLDALSEDTDLVTVTIGGNDKGLFPSWYHCRQLTSSDPKGSPCADAHGEELLGLVSKIRRNLGAALAEIQRRAPDAVVIVATYPQVFPDEGTCELASAYAKGDLAYINSIVDSLSDAMTAAAREAGVAWVDVYEASRGHDVCSKDPWVNGFTQEGTQDQTRATALHPFPEEQAAVARLILDMLVLPEP